MRSMIKRIALAKCINQRLGSIFFLIVFWFFCFDFLVFFNLVGVFLWIYICFVGVFCFFNGFWGVFLFVLVLFLGLLFFFPPNRKFLSIQVTIHIKIIKIIK